MSRHFYLTVLIGCLMLALPCSSAAARLQAPIIIVNSMTDDPTGCPTACTLRSAITTAHPGDVIVFDPNVAGVIIVTETLVIDKDLTISGPGADVLALDGGQQVGVLKITAGVTVRISGLAIQNGRSASGGGIDTSGELVVMNSTFSGNAADDKGGGIANIGTLVVMDSTFSSNTAGFDGGGIYNRGTLIIAASIFSENSVPKDGSGGGILNSRTSTVTASTFSGNTAGYSGGGIGNGGDLSITSSTFSGNSSGSGGGIYNGAGRITITSSTFSGNQATYSGGGIYNFGMLTVMSSTFSSNAAGTGGGIGSDAVPLTLSSTIIAGNTADTKDPDIYGEANSLGYNLIGNAESLSWLQANDRQNVDPLLGPLANNGGSTQTIALLDGSPAIDAGASGRCPEIDQRGALRVGTCDIGAYESGGVVTEE
jgi:CSLREA domain-containing protein